MMNWENCYGRFGEAEVLSLRKMRICPCLTVTLAKVLVSNGEANKSVEFTRCLRIVARVAKLIYPRMPHKAFARHVC